MQIKGVNHMASFNFEIVARLGELSGNPDAEANLRELSDEEAAAKKDWWSKELTYTRWGERDAKFDLRSWGPRYEKTGKGLTLTKDELMKLKDILNEIDFDKY